VPAHSSCRTLFSAWTFIIPGEAVVGENEMEAAAGAENFRGVIFQRIAAGERGNFVAHDVLRAKAGESFPDFNLGDAFPERRSR